VFRERFALDYLQRLPALRQELLAASERFAKGLTVLGQPSAVIIIQTGSGSQPRAWLRSATERQANVRSSTRSEFIAGETVVKFYYCKRLDGYVTIPGASVCKVAADGYTFQQSC